MNTLEKNKNRKLKSNEITPLIVGFPLYDGVTLTDFVGPTDVFAFTNGFTPIWLAEEKRPIKTSAGTFVYPNFSFQDNYPPVDILFVPGGRADHLINNAMFNKSYQAFIKKAAGGAQWIGSVCVGAFILAAADLLKDCSVTTYWSQLANLRLLRKKYHIKIPRGYPRGILDEKKKRFSGAGISSSIDLALLLVEKMKGKQIAEETQLYIQYAPKPTVKAGDPDEAPSSIVNQVTMNEAVFTKFYFDAVQRLLNTK